jgi:peptide/nickel transport system substrate-binding protein
MSQMTVRRLAVCAALALLTLASPSRALATEGELRWGLHVTLAAKWLDPAETEAFNTPYMIMYAVHDALVKPMPAGMTTPSLAESWKESPDHLSYTFTLRKNAKFHDG